MDWADIRGVGVGYDWDADEACQSEGVGGGVSGCGQSGGFISRETRRAAVCRW